jgi:predicted nucleic acid-binding protein
MTLIDSNLIIYAAKPEYAFLRPIIEAEAPRASAITYLEVVGYHKLTEVDLRHFEEFFRSSGVLPISEIIIQRAVRLRRERRMSLADAIIAGTALQHDCKLMTRNTADFEWIQGLELLNPFENSTSGTDERR